MGVVGKVGGVKKRYGATQYGGLTGFWLSHSFVGILGIVGCAIGSLAISRGA